ncbi:MAG TPA: TonB-dependent receptor [Bacteroidales bacterium]|nr:TonB-dependent receptor [Bacteroidales bacterium]HPF02703.1 TonB-dependent receptor [Bacteroidales bacterium]HPJ58533.1 TonB-dependent receptor [Bacteroidales bacterium]HPR11708.1 TonB-dependent receptor [Bacteroidales bacterium]HRW86458.1 TonB-dependent receptor [Bacteroidales bacterium]
MKRNLRLFLLLLIFISATSGIFAQITVSGTVIDTDNQPVIGANVVVKGTTIGTMTDVNGKFTLNVPSSSSIVTISFIGYVPQEIVVGNNTVLNVTLESEATALSEVVVIGYGTVKKRDLTGSVASIDGTQIAAVPVSNAAQALTGKLPGVSVVSQDGRPDASISIRVRGGGSISQSNDPLFIVDGFPVSSISDIPADLIESIDVLKDASSTAIYGARGANGVIIVTTKGAKAGKLTVNYDGYMQFNQPTKYLETLNAYDYIAYNWGYARAISAAYANAWEMLWAIGSQAGTYGNSQGIDFYKNVEARNYSKDSYGNSFSHNHNLNITGGSENSKYLFAANYIDNEGMKINSWYKRFNATFKIDQKIFEKLNLTFDTRFSDIDRMGSESTTNARGSILSSSYQFRPIATEDVQGELNDVINTQLGMYDIVLQDRYNPVERMKDYLPESRGRSLRSNIALSWEIINGLTARSELGVNAYWNKSLTWSGAIYNDYLDTEGNKTYGGNASIGTSEGWGLRWANTLSYDVQGLGSNQTLNVMAGQEVTNSGSSSISIWGNKYPSSFDSDRAFAMMDQYLSGTTTVNSGFESNTGTPNRLLSYFGRLNYSLLNKYLLTMTFRADGSSRFAPTNRWGYFPAAALGWRVSEEDFMKSIAWLNNLKLRVSYGSVGNDGISANLWKTNWSSTGPTAYSINEVQQIAYTPASTIANPNLKWETTITRNAGIDFAFLKSRIYGTLDFYWNSTKDLLMLTSVSAISGFSSTYDNIGSTSNKGVELAIGGDIIRKSDFSLSADFNININRGKVEELAPGVNGLYRTSWASVYIAPLTGDYILVEGQPVGQVRGYQYDGWYTTDDFNYDAATQTYTLKEGVPDIASGIIGTVYGTSSNKPGGQSAYPGVIKLKDISGPDGEPDGLINDYDVDIIGDMNPKHTGGFNINGRYKGIDLGLNFNWSYGNQIYNANYLAALMGIKEDGLYRNRLDVLGNSYKIYDVQNGQLVFVTDPAQLDALNANAGIFMPYQENAVTSTLGIQDGSFLRLNTVTLGYTLPSSLTGKINIRKVRVYGAIYNALTFTSYKGLDPEVNTNTSQGGAQYPTIGLDWGAYPRARSFTLGINVEF